MVFFILFFMEHIEEDMDMICGELLFRIRFNDIPVLLAGVEYDLDRIKEITKDYSVGKFAPFIQSGIDTKVTKFKGYYKYPKCKNDSHVELSKVRFIEILTTEFKKCSKCLKKERESSEKIYKENATKREKEKKELESKLAAEKKRILTDFIDNYCNPEMVWGKEIKDKYLSLVRAYYGFDRELLIGYLKKMKYYEFLKTPYWKAIAYEVKRKAGFKCAICNSSENLAAHHRTYAIRGNEIDNLKDLTCLCNNCHEKYHNI